MLAAFLGVVILSSWQTNSSYIPQELSEILERRNSKGTMFFKKDVVKNIPGFTSDQIFKNYSHLFSLDEGITFRFNQSKKITRKVAGEYVKHFYDMYYNDYLVKERAANFKEKNGVIVEGGISNLDLNLNTDVKLTQEEIIDLAKKIVPAEKYMWELDPTEISNKQLSYSMSKNNNLLPQPLLRIVKIGEKYKLVYEVKIETFKPRSYRTLLIDPISGVLISNRSAYNSCTKGSATTNCENINDSAENVSIIYYVDEQTPVIDPIPDPTIYNNIRTFVASTQDVNLISCNTERRLKENSMRNIEMYDWDAGPAGISGYSWRTNVDEDCVANTFYWGAERTTDYFRTDFQWSFSGRLYLGFSNNTHVTTAGGGIIDPPPGNNWLINLGRGNEPEDKPAVTLDVICHEFVHGIDEFTANMFNGDVLGFTEDGIVEESFCDIFGVVLEGKYKPIDWDIGSDYKEKVRRLDDPHLSFPIPEPKFYKGEHWFFEPMPSLPDDLGKYTHHNTGVINYWFHLIADGGIDFNEDLYFYTVNSVGIDAATNIVFKTLTEQFLDTDLYPNRDFEDVVNATIQVSIEEYSICSFEHEQIVEAWKAVGLLDCENLDVNNVITDNGDGTITIHLDVINGSGCYGYEWLFDGDVIPGENGGEIIISEELIEDLSVEISDEFLDCLLVVDGFSTTSVDNLEDIGVDVNVYPNPSSDLITINVSTQQQLENVDIFLYDISGKIISKIVEDESIFQNHSITTHLGNLYSGLYLLHISTPTGHIVKKIFKK